MTDLFSLLDQASSKDDEGPRAALKTIESEVNMCRLCPRFSTTNKVTQMGEGNEKDPTLAFVLDAPTREDLEDDTLLSGNKGNLLKRMYESIGLTYKDVYVTTALKCKSDMEVMEDHLTSCKPFLDRELAIVRPRAIVAMGPVAAKAVTGSSKDFAVLRGRWLRWRDKRKTIEIPVRVTFHPSDLLIESDLKKDAFRDLKLTINWVNRGFKENV